MKKIIIGILVVLIGSVGVLFAINGSSHYDPSKYSLSIMPTDKPFGIGAQIDFTLPDQFDSPKMLSNDTQKLLFVFTKPTGHVFKSMMAYQAPHFLKKHKIVAVADVSGMPTVILNTFAMPDFRKSPYSILLIYDKNMAQKLKAGQAVDKVIVMTLKNKKVIKIEHATNEAQLAKLLGGKIPGK